MSGEKSFVYIAIGIGICIVLPPMLSVSTQTTIFIIILWQKNMCSLVLMNCMQHCIDHSDKSYNRQYFTFLAVNHQ